MPFSRRAAPAAITAPVPQQAAADRQPYVFHLQCGQTAHDAGNGLCIPLRIIRSSSSSSRRSCPACIAVLKASTDSSTTAAASTTDNRAGSTARNSPQQQQQQPAPAASATTSCVSGLVPALFLGDVFITANTVAGIISSSATAAAEGRMPTARHSRTHRAAQQQQQHQVDPASALLLKLMQPLPQPFPVVDHSSDQQQPQQRMIFYVQKESAELVRQELLLHRYCEVVAARAAAGLPTTAADPSSSSSSIAPGHRKTMLEHIQAAITGSSSSSGDQHGTAEQQSSVPQPPPPSPQQQQQQQQQHVPTGVVGKVMQDLHAKVVQLLPGSQQQQQQQHDSSAQGGGGTAAAAGPGAVAATAASQVSSSSSGMVGARRSLPAVLAAQLSSFMSDLTTLEEEAVLREGQQLMQQRKQQQHKKHGSNSRTKQAAAAGSSDVSPGGGHAAFNFASYVARIPLAAAMSLLQPRLANHQQQQQPSQNSSSGSSSSSAAAPSDSSGGYDLAISGGDLRACLALQHRDTFVDLDEIRPDHHDQHQISTWQLGVYEPSSSDEDDDDEDDVDHDEDVVENVNRHRGADRYITKNQRKIAAAASVTTVGDEALREKALTSGPHDSSSSSKQGGRFRWGSKEQSSSKGEQQQQQQQQQSLESTRHQTGHPHHGVANAHQDQIHNQHQSELLSAAYTALSLPSVGDSSPSQPVALRDLEQQQQQQHDYGEVRVPLSEADIGLCDRTPVFQVPGLTIVLDTSHGEVSFTPTFLSLGHLVSLLHTAKTAATKIWLHNRRVSRKNWRHGVEMAAAALAAGSSSSRYGSSSGYGGSSRSAMDDDSDEDSDGMGDPPEAKALLEELGEAQPGSRANNNRATAADKGGSSSSSGAVVPNRKGLPGVLNTVALGTISLAAAGCCAVQELLDQTAVAVPAVGEWVIGLPNSVNIKAAFLEDLAAAAATYNTERLKPPKMTQSSAAAAAVAASAAAATKVGELYDPLGLVTKGDQSHQQQQQPVPAPPFPSPPLVLPSLDGLRLLLAAGWSVVHDVLCSDGSLAGHIISNAAGSSRRMGLGTLQVTEDGEIALRLGVAVKAAPVHMMTPSARQQQNSSRSSSSIGPSISSDAHVFDVGVHVNLSRLIGVPSMWQEDQLAAARGGRGAAAQGILLIGDLGLEPGEMTDSLWRGPQLGFGVLPVKPLVVAQEGGDGGCSRVSR